MFSFFASSKKNLRVPFLCDMHSHLLAGIDDGVKTHDEAKAVIQKLQQWGYQKLITTPHVINDSYRNTPEGIERKLTELVQLLKSENSKIIIQAAAEYYLDEAMVQRVENNEPILCFGNRYLLFETNYLTEPYTLNDFIFKASTKGYKLVLAHPERYYYMTLEKAEDLYNRGVHLQINMLSLSGYYGKAIQKMAEKIIEQKWIGFLGTDCHNLEHAKLIEGVLQSKAFKKAIELPLLNSTL